MTRSTTTFSVLAACAVLAVCAPVHARQNAGSPPPNPAVTDLPALIIHMKDSAYVPSTATVKIGQTIQFLNDDQVGHTATAADGSFDSGYIGKGETWRTSFPRTGTMLFSDLYHPAMHGSIVVVAN